MGPVYLLVRTNLVEPGRIEGPVSIIEEEADATWGVVSIHDLNGGQVCESRMYPPEIDVVL